LDPKGTALALAEMHAEREGAQPQPIEIVDTPPPGTTPAGSGGIRIEFDDDIPFGDLDVDEPSPSVSPRPSLDISIP